MCCINRFRKVGIGCMWKYTCVRDVWSWWIAIATFNRQLSISLAFDLESLWCYRRYRVLVTANTLSFNSFDSQANIAIGKFCEKNWTIIVVYMKQLALSTLYRKKYICIINYPNFLVVGILNKCGHPRFGSRSWFLLQWLSF